MYRKIITLLLAMSYTIGLLAQTPYNPFTQNINFNPEPTVAGFSCGSNPSVEFTMGLTTSADATDWQNNPLKVKICITGFEFDGAASAVVTGSYASNFDWAFDNSAGNCLVGTQNKVLFGVGTNPLFPNPLSSGIIEVALKVPNTSPISTVLSVNVNLIVPAYMATYNSVTDDPEASQTQTFCDLSISGTVFHDTTNANFIFDRHIGFGTPNNNTLYANLINSGSVVDVVPVNSNGKFSFLNVTESQTYQVILSTTQGTLNGPAPTPMLPFNWTNTGEDCCDGAGSDGTIDGTTTVAVTNASKENVDFGITMVIPTPVLMSAFNVSEYACNALVFWTTASEQNVSHFDILRKDESNEPFKLISTVKANGNSSAEINYSFVDKQVAKSNSPYQYQIRSVDLDGTKKYSEIKSLRIACEQDQASAYLFPNPVTNLVNFVYITNSDNQQLIIDMLDITGRRLSTSSSIVNSGTNLISLETKGLAEGQYLIRFRNVEEKVTKTLKFIKQ